ncbi:MAG: hypothetical protein V3T05_08610 [Myxococcota bacterium]
MLFNDNSSPEAVRATAPLGWMPGYYRCSSAGVAPLMPSKNDPAEDDNLFTDRHGTPIDPTLPVNDGC